MAASPRPHVRTMLLCDEVIRDPEKPKQISLLRLVSSLRAEGGPVFPAFVRQVCVFAQLTECRGQPTVRVDVYHPDSESIVHATPAVTPAASGNDPLAVRGVTIRLRHLIFPTPGLYTVRLWVADEVLAERPFVLR